MRDTVRKPKPRRSRQAGFTLIEVMVTVAIIALLTTVAVIATPQLLQWARSSKARADISQIENACSVYAMQSATLPSLSEAGVDSVLAQQLTNGVPKDPWGRDYVIEVTDDNTGCRAVSLGADGRQGGTDADADITSVQS